MAESSDTMDMKEFQLHEKDTGSADVQVARWPAGSRSSPNTWRATSKITPRAAAFWKWSRNDGVFSITSADRSPIATKT